MQPKELPAVAARNAVHTGVYRFGPYQFDPAGQKLQHKGETVRIGSRALEILKVLVEANGELVDKEALISRVWPTTVVEEAALRVHISALRKILGAEPGERYFLNIPGRGYRFVAPIQLAARICAAAEDPPRPNNLPAQLTRPIGREGAIKGLTDALQLSRLVTIVGPGGVGKTTVAVAVSDAVLSSFGDGVYFVDLASVLDPPLVESSIAAALGLPTQSSDVMLALKAHLHGKSLLLVLDCCEHVVTAVARLAIQLLEVPDLRILATSRESLRVAAEKVWRLPPLCFPEGSVRTASEAVNYPSVQLFAERAAAVVDEFQLADTNAAWVADICRLLDGIPLAIELAAGRFDALGIGGLHSLLHERLLLELTGSRTALPRHQTLHATIEWSYELLSDVERRVFRRLSVFAGDFTLDGAREVPRGPGVDDTLAIEHISALVSKSLIAANVGGPTPLYRMLETVRIYAREKLIEAGEADEYARRHCEYMHEFLNRVTNEWDAGLDAERLATYARKIDNLRAALDWSFAPGGDAHLAIAITLGGAPIWLHLGMIQEWREWTERAVQLLPSLGEISARDLAGLYVALGTTRQHTLGMSEEALEAWTTALDLAKRVGEPKYVLPVLWALWSYAYACGRTQEALGLAQEYREIAESKGTPEDVAMGDDMAASVYRTLGDQAAALRYCMHVRRRDVAPSDRVHASRFMFDQNVAALSTLGDVLWVSGYPDQASEVCEAAVDHARQLNHLPSLAYALIFSAAQVAILSGDEPTMDVYDRLLAGVGEAHEPFADWVNCIHALMLIRRGDARGGTTLLQAALARHDPLWFHRVHIYFLTAMAEGFCSLGEISRGLALVERAIEQSHREQDFWCMPDVYRVRGDLLAAGLTPSGSDEAETAYLMSLDWARRQSTLSWEMRGANGLASLWLSQSRRTEAEAVLKRTYNRFTEGFGTADLRRARHLVDLCSI